MVNTLLVWLKSRGRITGRSILVGRVFWGLLILGLAIAGCNSSGEVTSIPVLKHSPTSPPAKATLKKPEFVANNTPTAQKTNPPPMITPSAHDFPNPDGFKWVEIANGVEKPVELVSPADGSGRLFIVEKIGRILIYQAGGNLPGPFLDIHSRVGSQSSEQGLLGLAFSPTYSRDGAFYINYTDTRGNTVIARYHTSNNPNLADPASEEALIRVEQPFPNHNGGKLAFGPDGYLYSGLGDGGNQGDPLGNGQSLDTLLGKLLRIDVSGPSGYSIPSNNPFAGGGGKPEIWAYGLRNPWRFSFDHLNGDLYIADVGQSKWEEIDYLVRGSQGGANFGWNYREGFHPYAGNPPAGLKLVDPIFEYGHDQGCSITGGYVYRGSALPEWQGIYLFGDYCSGLVWGLLPKEGGGWKTKLLFNTGAMISSFGEDDSGELYLLDYQSNRVLKLVRQ